MTSTDSIVAWLDTRAADYAAKAERLAAVHEHDLRDRVASAQQAMIWYRLADLADEHRFFAQNNTLETVVFSMAKRVASSLVQSDDPDEAGWRQALGLYYSAMFDQLKKGGR